ncbi:hypothetical protein NIES2109_01920 [Nostoc sp. HK-01]|nr:hypothetical protein NIES2109_01920 [Nostoc sp. HK-01]
MNPPNELAQEFHGYVLTEYLYWVNMVSTDFCYANYTKMNLVKLTELTCLSRYKYNLNQL